MNFLTRRINLALTAATVLGIVTATVPVRGGADDAAAPIYGVTLPSGYRNWTLISVARVGGNVNDLRAKLGNDVAAKAFRDGTRPFPDGTIIARLAYQAVGSEENNQALRPLLVRQADPAAVDKLLAESMVAGPATNVQFMVKDSKKYASSGGWGFAQFSDGKPADEAVMKTCFGCHQPAKDRDFVYTRYAP